MCVGAGACLNPALGMSQTTYMIAMKNIYEGVPKTFNAKAIWVYMCAPFIGAALASYFFKFYQKTLN